MALASQIRCETVRGRWRGPAGSGVYASARITMPPTTYLMTPVTCMAGWKFPKANSAWIGDGREMRVLGVGSLKRRMHSKTDFDVKLNEVNVTVGVVFTHFSLHDAQARLTIILDNEGAHQF